ncbi:cytochrome P450, partial [Lactifluus subvellereus]
RRHRTFNHRVSHSALPGRFLVEMFPWMMYIPERFAKWKREGLKQGEEHHEMFQRLVDRVRADLASGGTRPSFCASLIQEQDRNYLTEPELAFLAGQMYSAASETTVTAMLWCTLAMVAFPDVQRRAQAELDAVVGRARLPTFADAPYLPYVRAIVRETLRWRPALMLGLPHVATEEDWYGDVFIPKGATCMANIWHCNHDRTVFGDDADEFRPERYLDGNGELTTGATTNANQDGHFTYGFGRRACVGRHLANDELFMAMARILWATNLEPARDENGDDVPLDTESLVDVGVVM